MSVLQLKAGIRRGAEYTTIWQLGLQGLFNMSEFVTKNQTNKNQPARRTILSNKEFLQLRKSENLLAYSFFSDAMFCHATRHHPLVINLETTSLV